MALAHHRIADWVRAEIASGALAPGDALPSAGELAERWRCSTFTARKAISALRGEGRITRGKPPRVQEGVRREKIALADGWTQTQKDLVLRPEHERAEAGAIELTAGISIVDCDSTAQYADVAAEHDLADVLDIDVGTPLVRRSYEMVHRTSGHRVAWSVSHIPRRLIEANPALLDERNEPWPGGHQHQLHTVGIELDRFERTIHAAQPSPAEGERWGVAAGTPMLHVLSTSIDTGGRAVEHSEAHYPADRTEITFTERLHRWTDQQRRGGQRPEGS